MAETAFDPRPLLAALAEPQLEIVLIGGLALVARGIVRPTGYIDFCYAPTRETAAGLAAALALFHPRLRAPDTEEGMLLARIFRWDARAVRQGSNLTLLTDLGPVDLLAHVPGIGGYPEVRAAATLVPLFGRSLAILDLPGLLRTKQAAGRPKDPAVLPELEALIRLRAIDARQS